MNQSLRRFAVSAGLIAAAVLAPAPAHAASPQPERFHDTDEFTDEDFCGTGEEVTVTIDVKGVEFLSPKDADYVQVFQGTVAFTYGDTTVLNHVAGRFTEVVSVGANGEQTIAYTTKGLPESFRVKGGGLITRDAGSITFLLTFDEDGNLISETFTAKGPHPQADSGFALFCETLPAALGIV